MQRQQKLRTTELNLEEVNRKSPRDTSGGCGVGHCMHEILSLTVLQIMVLEQLGKMNK